MGKHLRISSSYEMIVKSVIEAHLLIKGVSDYLELVAYYFDDDDPLQDSDLLF